MTPPARGAIVVFALVIGVVGAISAVVGFGTDGATAVRVGDSKISREAVNDELRVLAELSGGQVRTTRAAIGSDVGAALLSQVVGAELARVHLARVGERVTAGDRASARDQVRGSNFRTTPDWFQARYLERIAALAALTRVSDDDTDAAARAIRRVARRVEVRVDPAYGRWVGARGEVVPVQVPADLTIG